MALAKSFDSNLAKALEEDETFLGIVSELKRAASAEITVRDDQPCPKNCGCQHIRQVKVPDYKLKLQIMEFLANRGVGRPGTVEPGERQVTHEYRLEWVRPDDGSPVAT